MSHHYKKDGTLDMRYKSSKSYVNSGGSCGGPRADYGSTSSRPTYSTPSYNTTSSSSRSYATTESSHKSSSDSRPSVLLTKSGDIDKRCSAVRNGDIFFKQDGTIDKRCSAVKRNKVTFDSNDKPSFESVRFSSATSNITTSKTESSPIFSFNTERSFSSPFDMTFGSPKTSTSKPQTSEPIGKYVKTVVKGNSVSFANGQISTEKNPFKIPNDFIFKMQPTSSASLYTDYDIKLNMDGTVNRNSRAVKSGDILFKSDGTIDRRCNAYRQNKIILDSNDQIDFIKMRLLTNDSPSSSAFKTQPASSASLYTSDDIKLNMDGTVNMNSRAVRRGDIMFKSDGTIDKRCNAYKQNKIILDSDDQIDFIKMGLLTNDRPSSSAFKTQPASSASLYTDYDIKLNMDGTVNMNSRAVRRGDIMFKSDGTIDKRCNAYKQNKIILDPNGQIDFIKMGLLTNERPSSSAFKTQPASSASLYTDYDIKLNMDGTINMNSRAVRRGDIMFKSDGTIDKRCNAYKQNKIILDSNGQIDFIKMGLLTNDRPSSSAFKTQPASSASLYTSDDIKLNIDGTVNRNSRAVRRGDILFKSDGSIDRRCNAYKQNKIILDSNGQIDSVQMGLKIPAGRPSSTSNYQTQSNSKISFDDLNLTTQQDPFASIDPHFQKSTFTPTYEKLNKSSSSKIPQTISFNNRQSFNGTFGSQEIYSQQALRTSYSNSSTQQNGIESITERDVKFTNDDDSEATDKNDHISTEKEKDEEKQHNEYMPYKLPRKKAQAIKENLRREKEEAERNRQLQYETLLKKSNEMLRQRLKAEQKRNERKRKEEDELEKEEKPIQKEKIKLNKKIICFVSIAAFILSYFILLSTAKLPLEMDYVSKCPKQAVCDISQEGNLTKMKINFCRANFVKLEDGLLQICSPGYEPRLSEYMETLKAASYISKKDGDCLFKFEKIGVEKIIEKFPRADINLLRTDEDFQTIYEKGEFISMNPEYNSICRIYINSTVAMPIQTLLIIIISIIAIFATEKHFSD